MDKDKKDSIFLIFYTLGWIVLVFLLVLFLNNKYRKLRYQAEFESLREGVCVYVEYPNAYDAAKGPVPDYLLVYDYETEKVIEVDIYEELIHTRINVGDTIVYVVDYNYTDADFINVIKEN